MDSSQRVQSTTIGDAERLHALLTNIPRRRSLVLHGGNVELRAKLFEYISPRVDVANRFIPDLLALTPKEQEALRDELADRRDPFIVVIGTDKDLSTRLEDGLDSGLYFRLSGGLRWAVKDSDAALIRPPATSMTSA